MYLNRQNIHTHPQEWRSHKTLGVRRKKTCTKFCTSLSPFVVQSFNQGKTIQILLEQTIFFVIIIQIEAQQLLTVAQNCTAKPNSIIIMFGFYVNTVLIIQINKKIYIASTKYNRITQLCVDVLYKIHQIGCYILFNFQQRKSIFIKYLKFECTTYSTFPAYIIFKNITNIFQKYSQKKYTFKFYVTFQQQLQI
eukprot:TRINITY_DN5436_c1_g1_i7.p2 TRINITY_DN5436_c1_g1~~TRINITY_DN5436_c1_g1_i7.p2  ORF type:complete len:194 (+),score=-18.71 TRINITY_DN5436_c1_g1_i7:268-849(+)